MRGAARWPTLSPPSLQPAGASALQQRRGDIDRAFGRETVEAIMELLPADGDTWAQGLPATLAQKSPKCLKLTLAAIRNARRLASLEQALAIEFRLCTRLFEDGEFPEGVRALIIDKDRKPKWSPARLEDVSAELVARYLGPLPAAEDLTFQGDVP